MAKPGGNLVTCQNYSFSCFGRDRGKDIIRRGKNRACHQLYKCLHWGHKFADTILTLLYHKHMSEAEIRRI